MCLPVTHGAERDQVLLLVLARMAAELKVVNLQLGGAPAVLTPPSVAAEH
jgi:hypothetical protein